LSLKRSYTFIAPFYDAAIAAATRSARQHSLRHLPAPAGRVLLAGVGTGLDLPYLPPQHHYVGLDLTHAMLRRALPRQRHTDFQPVQGDAQRLPFADASFDAVVLHLILAVVPNPPACLREVARVLKPGGKVLVFDKFLRPGQLAPMRRLANPLLRRLATRLDVVFEDTLAHAPQLRLLHDQPALAGGWFRFIHLQRAE
jgi:phosphatidylethanolamine/phosphatidyl-N-methylethanolamine N-methyltransferase